jgi:hypothetical protein
MRNAAIGNRAERKTKDRRIGERIFDDDKSRAPEQAAKGEGEIGAEAFGHVWLSHGAARASA